MTAMNTQHHTQPQAHAVTITRSAYMQQREHVRALCMSGHMDSEEGRALAADQIAAQWNVDLFTSYRILWHHGWPWTPVASLPR